MERTVRQIAYDIERSSRRIREELVTHLERLEATGRGNSDLAWRIRDYRDSVTRLFEEAQ
jgi:hypothetical protein